MTQGPIMPARLKCDSCGSIYFHKRLSLNYRQGGGTNEEQAGYCCRQCGADVDISRMIQRLDLERKKEELRQLQQEIGQVPSDSLKVQDKSTVQLKEG